MIMALDVKSFKVLQISCTWINARVDTCYHELSRPFKRPRAVASDQTSIKCEISLHFKLALNTLWSLSVSTDKNINDWGQQIVGVYIENSLVTRIDTNFFPWPCLQAFTVIWICYNFFSILPEDGTDYEFRKVAS